MTADESAAAILDGLVAMGRHARPIIEVWQENDGQIVVRCDRIVVGGETLLDALEKHRRGLVQGVRTDLSICRRALAAFGEPVP